MRSARYARLHYSAVETGEAVGDHMRNITKRKFDGHLRYRNGFSIQDDPGLVQYIRSVWLDKPAGSSLKLASQSGKKDFSEIGQSVFVDMYLERKKNGFFVECGAADGEKFSNTLYFELERGWTGLLIEANVQFYAQLLQKHRNAYSINACLSPKNQTAIARFQPGELVGGLEETFLDIQESHMAKYYVNSSQINVQCFTLYSILLAVGVNHVDYLSLDIEGAELDVLKTIPFEKLFIDVIGVEYRVWGGRIDVENSLKRLEEFRMFFEATGLYAEIDIGPSYPWKTEEEVEREGLDVFFKRKTAQDSALR